MPQTLPKTVFYRSKLREPHWSPEVWNVEPFDADLELWTLGADAGFVWALVPADPESSRCRTVPREKGVDYLRTVWNEEPSAIVLAGNLAGRDIEIEVSQFIIQIADRYAPIDISEYADQVARVCEYLRQLQFYDGDERYNKDSGDVTTFVDLLSLEVTGETSYEGWLPTSRMTRII